MRDIGFEPSLTPPEPEPDLCCKCHCEPAAYADGFGVYCEYCVFVMAAERFEAMSYDDLAEFMGLEKIYE